MSNNLKYKKIYDINNNLIYEGEIKNNLYHGNGKTYYKNGNINFDGVFFEGKSTGNGIKYYENGSILYKSANCNINDSVIFDKNDINLVNEALDSIIFDEEPDTDLLNNDIEDMFNEVENNNKNKENESLENMFINNEESDLNMPLIKKINKSKNENSFINNICIYLKDKINDLLRNIVSLFR